MPDNDLAISFLLGVVASYAFSAVVCLALVAGGTRRQPRPVRLEDDDTPAWRIARAELGLDKDGRMLNPPRHEPWMGW